MSMPFALVVLLPGIYHKEIIGQACKPVCSRVFLIDEPHIKYCHQRLRCSAFIEMGGGLQHVIE